MTRNVLALAVVLFTSVVAVAQPNPGVGAARRPTFSPYLNLLNQGGNPGLNYLGIVRPQQQLQQQFNQLNQQTNQQLQALGQAYDSQLGTLSNALPPTGTVSVFNSTGGYFGRIPTGGGGGVGGFGGGGMGQFGGSAGAMGAMQRPAFAGAGGGGGVGGARPPAGGRR